MKRLWVLVCVCILGWGGEVRADESLPLCSWSYPEVMEAKAGAPILVSGEFQKEDCRRGPPLVLLAVLLDANQSMIPVLTSEVREEVRFEVWPERPLEPGTYTLRLPLRGGEGMQESELRVLPAPLRVSVRAFTPIVSEGSGIAYDACGVPCGGKLENVWYVAGVEFEEETPIEIRVQYSTYSEPYRKVPEVETLKIMWRSIEPREEYERWYREFPGGFQPCARFIASAMDMPRTVLSVSEWSCAMDHGCAPEPALCPDPDGGVRDPASSEEPTSVTARPSGGCGGCATAPEAPRSSLLVAFLLLLGWRKRAPHAPRDA